MTRSSSRRVQPGRIDKNQAMLKAGGKSCPSAGAGAGRRPFFGTEQAEVLRFAASNVTAASSRSGH